MSAAEAEIDDKNIFLAEGHDGFPAFGFRTGNQVKQPYRMYLPDKLPSEFTLVAVFKLMNPNDSYLFAILNPFETVVQLGIRVSVSEFLRNIIKCTYTLCIIYVARGRCNMYFVNILFPTPRYYVYQKTFQV